MRKLFLLISILALSIVANATTININTETSDALRKALTSANDGDEIIMAAGTYVESPTNYIAFASKGVVVRAADGANVILKPHVPVTLSGGARAEFRGIKIDVSELCSVNDYSHLIYPSDNAANNRLVLDGCEIYGFDLNSSLINCGSDKKLDVVSIANCYFHNIKKSCLFIESTGAINISISNSTFADITTVANSYYAGVIDSRATSGSFSVDHCTFYNVQVMSTDYAAIGKVKDSGKGIHGDVQQNNCIFADPLFTDAANGDFSYAGNWNTMSISPAREAGTDGSDLGDPRWYTDETLPSTSFATAYDLLGTKAQLKGNIRLNASNHIEYYNNSENGTAKWKLQVGRICRVSAVVDVEAGCTSGRQLTLTVKDADGNTVATLAQAAVTYNDADINLGEIVFEKTGDYSFILTNSTSHSSAILEKITLTYEGGAVKNIATDANTTLNVADAWFSGCTRDNEKTYIQYPSSETSSAWIKWNIATSETKYYDLTVNVNTDYAHGFTIAIYEDEEAEPVASVTEGSYVNTTGDGLALEIGRVNLVGGKNYVVKVTNAPSGSQAKVTSVVFAPVVATATELPGTLAFNNAVLSEKAFIQDGMLYFNEIGDTDPRGQWAQWEVTTDHNGLFLFTMGVTSDNGQDYKITIKDDSENVLDYYETSFNSGDKTVKHYFALETGSYFVKVENTRSYSKGHLTSLVVTEPDDIVVIDETEASMSVLNAENRQGNKNYQIIRTIVPGMYNTICLPFDLTNAELKAAFGSDVVLKEMESATVEAGDFVLNLNFKEATSVRRCRPYLIKTSRNIVNPVFGDVEVKIDDASEYITTGTNANFVSTLIKGTIPASENNLFLGANNTLYFPTVDMEILGMRAYFVIHDAPSGAVKRARIIEREQIITDVELVAEQPNAKSQKILRGGQLIIIRDGNMYNVMGAKLQ